MHNRKRFTYFVIVVGVFVLGAAGFLGRGYLVESWYLRQLESKDADEQREAVRRLVTMRSARAIPELIQVLEELPEASFRGELHEQLEEGLRHVRPAGVSSLLDALYGSPRVRYRLALIVTQLKDPKARTVAARLFLQRLLSAPMPVALAASWRHMVWLSGFSGRRQDVGYSTETVTAIETVYWLSHLGDATVNVAEPLLASNEAANRQVGICLLSIVGMNKRSLGSTYERLLVHANDSVRSASAEALLYLTMYIQWPGLRVERNVYREFPSEALTRSRPWRQSAMSSRNAPEGDPEKAKILEVLAAGLRDSAATVRTYCAITYASLQKPAESRAVLATLERALDHADNLVRERAALALSYTLRDKPADDPLFLRTKRIVVSALTKVDTLEPSERRIEGLKAIEHRRRLQMDVTFLRDALVPDLVVVLREGDARAREAAARVLAQLEHFATPAEPQLILSLRDPHSAVRLACLAALRGLDAESPELEEALKALLDDENEEIRARAKKYSEDLRR